MTGDALSPKVQEPREVGRAFLPALAMLGVVAAPFVYFVIGKIFGFGVFVPAMHACPDVRECSVNSAHYIGLNWLAILSCAAFFGALGVMISLYLRQKNEESLFGDNVPKLLASICGFGAILGVLMLSLFIGGFVQGNLFPKFSDMQSWLELNFRVADWGKLIIWSFIAGFSERLMPGLFDRLSDHFHSTELRKQ